LFYNPTTTEIEKTLDNLNFEMELNLKDNVARFLGVMIKNLENNEIELTQTGLIKQILEAIFIEGANSKSMSAKTEALPAYKLSNPT